MGDPVVHVELIGPDPDALRRFSAELFGWDAAPGAPVPELISASDAYSAIDPDPSAGPAAGGIGGGAGFGAHTSFPVGVDDVVTALDRAAALGGAVVLAPQRNEGGQVVVGHLTDPAGDLVGVAGPL